MIVLRLTIDGAAQEIRSSKPELRLGSDPTADVTVQNAGWGAQEARLVHEGASVRLERADGALSLQLRLGDETLIGRARLALVGLMPLESSRPATPVFGDYDVDPNGAQTFVLADDAAPVGTETTSHTFPAHDHRPRIDAAPRADAVTPPPPPPPRERASGGSKARTASAGSNRVLTQTRPDAKTRERQHAALTAQGEEQAVDEAARERARKALRQGGFSEELALHLRKSPFWVVSGAVHVLVFFILSLIPTAGPGWQFDHDGTLRASLDAHDDMLDLDSIEDELADVPRVEEALDALPELPDPDNPFEENEPADAPENDGPALRPQPTPDVSPVDIGLAPRLTNFRARRKQREPPVKSQELKQSFNKGQSDSINERSADVIRGQLGLGRGGGNRGRLPTKAELLVVQGSFDHMEKVLDALEIPYTTASSDDLVRGRRVRLDDYKFVFWNCGEAPQSALGAFHPKLEKWVRRGGYLFTTDWGIAHVVAPAFPEYVSTHGNRAPLVETVLHIEPGKDQKDHPLLDGVFLRDTQGQWWLEQASFDIVIEDRDAVDVLIECPQLKRIFHRDPAVAITFRHGKGRVLHVMGHYFQKMGNLAGTMAAHRLALNFVLERVRGAR